MFFDVIDQALQLVLRLPPMPLAASAACDDLRAIGDELDRRGRALEAVEQPVGLRPAPDFAGCHRDILVFLRRIFVVAIVQQEHLHRAVSKRTENARNTVGAVVGVGPHLAKHRRRLLTQTECAVGVVWAVVVVVPHGVTRHRAEHRLQVGVHAGGEVARRHRLGRRPVTHRAGGVEMSVAAIGNDEVGIVTDKQRHVRLLGGDRLVDWPAVELRHLAARAKGDSHLAGFRWHRRRAEGDLRRLGGAARTLDGQQHSRVGDRCQARKMQHGETAAQVLDGEPVSRLADLDRLGRERRATLGAYPNLGIVRTDMADHRPGLYQPWSLVACRDSRALGQAGLRRGGTTADQNQTDNNNYV